MSISRRLLPGLGLSLPLTLACGGEPEPLKKPPAPDMSALIAAYEAPTAALTPETAATVLDSVNALVAQLGELALEEQLLDTVGTTVDEQAEQSAMTGETSSALGFEQGQRLGKLEQRAIKGDAYLVATRICGGFGPEPLPDPLNGKITLNLGLTGEAIDAVMWGKFDACKYQLAGAEILLTGEQPGTPGNYSLYIGDDLTLGNFALTTVLFQLSVWAELDGEGRLLETDFRLNVETLELDVRIHLEQGYVIAHAGATLLAVSATNGDFGCDAEARVCSAGDERIEF